MELNVYNRTREKGYALYKKYFIQILNKTIEVLQLSDNISVSVIFVKDKRIKQINRDYRGIDRATDFISFALADNKDQNDYFENEKQIIMITSTRQNDFDFIKGCLILFVIWGHFCMYLSGPG